ncbi:MAG: enoyl-CoA hydratase/isomerase family protein [Desulfarculaceae bacterium]|nr:enoyl-CoA hydratase/isomerase family protein [Desulfarculaceae bacterium]MCF8071805.1 enoyl-CoA hydratase/isomerase family protein [Desulfarculaceae bacterium]MCF8101355.1 enoyl-CoA hydratase/isomerase family protein [Desulfarculaceae bacterium]MCF8117184.1 enoyl-CoA hydratase/isomerase family protein [Desulfarculaceae bacterium]
MAYKYILSEVKDKIGILTLNQPDKMNALGAAVEKEITDCLTDWAKGTEVKVVILRANGKVFCSGHDRLEVRDGTPSSIRNLFQTSYDMMTCMRKVRMPIIAQVHGIAMAGGCHLVAGCDLAVAAEEGAKFGMTGLKIGYNCSTPTVAVSRAVGSKKCLEMLFTGNLYSAQESVEMGLINRVVPDDKLEEETFALAQEIAKGSRITLGISKQVFYAQIEMTEDQAYHYAKEMMAIAALLPDAQEGFSAGIEKREPVFPEN